MGMHGTILSLPGGKGLRGSSPGNGPRSASAPGRRRGIQVPGIRRPGQRSLRLAWSSWPVTTAALLATACFCAIVEGPLWRHSTALAAVNVTFALVLVFTGLMLRREPGQGVPAVALMLAGIFRCVDFIDAWNGPWPAYAIVFGGVDRLFGGWALLRYPNSALSRVQRRYLAGLAVWMIAGRMLMVVTSTAPWMGGQASWWWPTVKPDEQLSDVLSYVVHGGEGIFGIALMVLLVMRLVRARGLDRIVITPIIVAGIGAVIAASATAVVMTLASVATTPNGAYLAESVADFAIPVAFLIAVVQRLLLVRNVTELTAQACLDGNIQTLRRALRNTLHDPTLELLDPSDASLPALDARSAGRLVSYVQLGADAPIAVVIADPLLARYRGLFDAAVRASGLALQNAQLQAKAAREELEQVKTSRARIIEAELAERRRLERDLHDGVQQHLLGITAHLTAAMTKTTDPEATAAFSEARDGLKAVLAELRNLAHGIHPAALTHGGLAVALEEVAERLPLPVRISVPARRLGAAVEATLYYVACEALANAVKHAQADSVLVSLQAGESWLEMEVADDGVGGVTTGASAGRGLANIADRVSALDGEAAIDSPPGRGTRVIVRIPCG
jgi:signal transduction histidine kinase